MQERHGVTLFQRDCDRNKYRALDSPLQHPLVHVNIKAAGEVPPSSFACPELPSQQEKNIFFHVSPIKREVDVSSNATVLPLL